MPTTTWVSACFDWDDRIRVSNIAWRRFGSNRTMSWPCITRRLPTRRWVNGVKQRACCSVPFERTPRMARFESCDQGSGGFACGICCARYRPCWDFLPKPPAINFTHFYMIGLHVQFWPRWGSGLGCRNLTHAAARPMFWDRLQPMGLQICYNEWQRAGCATFR